MLAPKFALLALLLAVHAAPLAAASTWIVDANGGPGSNFTDIGAAEAASQPGDVIVVLPGDYAGFTIDIAVSILGQGSELVSTGNVVITGVPAGGRVSLAGMRTRRIQVDHCLAPVLLEELVAFPMAVLPSQVGLVAIDSCADVRLRGVRANVNVFSDRVHALTVDSSRVEVTHSQLKGGNGHSHNEYTWPTTPEAGGDGIHVVGASSVVHVGSSDARGGGGGHLTNTHLCGACIGADGGDGMRVLAGSALVSGPADTGFYGGYLGEGFDCSTDGLPGYGIRVASAATLRYSLAAVQSSQSPYGCLPTLLPIDGTYQQASPDDPTLTYSGSTAPGQTLVLTLTGEPGSQASILLGRTPTTTSLPGVLEQQLTNPLRSYALGTLPLSGTATFSFALPANAPRGSLLVFQGQTTSITGQVALTTSVPITAR